MSFKLNTVICVIITRLLRFLFVLANLFRLEFSIFDFSPLLRTRWFCAWHNTQTKQKQTNKNTIRFRLRCLSLFFCCNWFKMRRRVGDLQKICVRFESLPSINWTPRAVSERQNLPKREQQSAKAPKRWELFARPLIAGLSECEFMKQSCRKVRKSKKKLLK